MGERVIPVEWSQNPREARLRARIREIRQAFADPSQKRAREDAEAVAMAEHFADAE